MKKRILIISPYTPYPIDSGGNIAQYTFLKELKNEFNIFFISPIGKDGSNIEDLKGKLPEVTFLPFIEDTHFKIRRLLFQKSIVFLKTLILKLFLFPKKISDSEKNVYQNTTLLISSTSYLDKSFISHIHKSINENKIDIVQVEFFEFISLGQHLPKNVKKTFVHHEIRYIREKRELNLIKNLPLFARNQLKRNKNFEIEALRSYDKIVTLSNIDLDELKYFLPEKDFISSPIPLLAKTANAEIVDFKFSNNITFLGGESHFPNKDGIEWFIHECWPKIKISNPCLKLVIIGKWREVTINEFRNDTTIEFLGFVDDLETVLKNSIFIVPIRIGSGVRMKIIEAINHRCPIISTSVGIEGLNFSSEVDYLRADNENLIVQQVIRLIKNPKLCKQLIESCKNTLERNYSYTELIDKRRSVYA